MAKGQDLSRYQRGIVKRYYEHLDTIALQKLGELVSELYLATGEKTLAKLWKQAETALAKTPADEARIQRIVSKRDVKELAELVAEFGTGR